ncbi:CIC11C00000003175 [Sungouiella intermedia]|uniref:CIC11C00000003175 n=1 Tax=Sungouiella intermedia TaxID=45354 RepID=A0A1L0CZ04_9ASCO|nr:CIC11C00000003175 [[Candida] intermedia]
MTDDPILDAIKEGRFPSAKRDLASKLKRFPNKSYYWALNCYYLYATGQADQAEKECKTLKQKVPSDTESLEILSEVFTKLGNLRDALEVWENAVKKYPSTDLILTWFDRAVRAFDTRNMQKASLILHKHAKSKRQYGIWAALCYYLAGIDTEVDDERSAQLLLALDLLEKSSPLHSNQEIFVKVSVLAEQKEYAAIRNVVLPLKYRELELTIIYLDALEKLEDWNQLSIECKKLLFEEKFNDFDTWKYFIKASKYLGVSISDLKALNVIGTRNSYVANMEIDKVYETSLQESVNAYFDKFASKPCCPVDLSNYELTSDFYHKIADNASELLKSDTLTASDATTLINIEKLQMIKDSKYQVQWSKYEKYTSPDLSDLYLMFAIQDLKKNWSPEHIVQHIIHLEHYSQEDPENFRVKLWLMNLYGAINTASLVSKVYKNLKIKMIQNDLYLYKLQGEPDLRNLNDLVQIYRFYLTSDGEVDATISKVFEKELYSKLEDLLKFGKRLSISLSRHLAIIKTLSMARSLRNDYYNYFYRILKESKEEILSDTFSVRDNRDFTTEYKFGIELPQLPIHDSEKIKGKEYVQLHYLKELLITEKNDVEIGKLLKLFNKWTNNPAYTSQLNEFEKHMFKLYMALFKVVKQKGLKDRALQVTFLTKNIDFKKIHQAFISKLEPLSGQTNHVLAGAHEFAALIKLMLNETPLVAAAQKFEKDMADFKLKTQQVEYLASLKGKLDFKGLSSSFVDEQFEILEEGLKNSIYRP